MPKNCIEASQKHRVARESNNGRDERSLSLVRIHVLLKYVTSDLSVDYAVARSVVRKAKTNK
jgi:hypothetical protein